ncbi:hypothetical protein ACFWU5_09745 [Nocardia sp. NPDC058640]|uniref:hypothetical protein n=1 Tax=Nocardia sp. NPDC058640 TaxID=3346571 RepID=UPI00365A9366
MVDGSVVTRVSGYWARSRSARYPLAAVLGMLGAVLWAMQALGVWMQSQEGKWQDDYLSVGSSTVATDSLLTMLAVVFLLIAGLLGRGAVLLLRGKRSGCSWLVTGAWMVILGQLFAAVLAWIPIDAFYHSAPANLVFATPLVVFPLLTVLCLTEGRRAPTGAD